MGVARAGHLRAFLIPIALCLAASIARSATVYNVTDLGVVLSTGDSGKDINQNNTAVYTRSTAAYYWSSGAEVPIPGVFANNGPLRLNNQNHLAYAQNQQGYIYRNGSSTYLGTLESGESSVAMDLNDSDVVVGYAYRRSVLRYRAFVWQNGTLTPLNGTGPGGTYGAGVESRAQAINNAGVIAGSYDGATASESAVIWTNNVATLLATLSGYARSAATDINDYGQVAGYSGNATTSQIQATIWNGTVPTGLGQLPGRPYTMAKGINDFGSVVGFAKTGTSDGGGNAFIWSTGGQMQDLNSMIAPGPWHLIEADAINNSGQIVGYGSLGSSLHSFLLTPVPEPSLLGVCCLVGFYHLVRRRSARGLTHVRPAARRARGRSTLRFLACEYHGQRRRTTAGSAPNPSRPARR